MEHEILQPEPTKPGWGIPPPLDLVLGKGQSECYHLPLGPEQGLRVAKAFPYDVAAHGHSPIGFDFFPSVRVYGPLYFCMDPSAGVVNLSQLFFWLWAGSGLGLTSRWFGWDFRPGPSCIGGTALRPHWGMAMGTLQSWERKRVRSGGNGGLLPNSLYTSNLTCFLLFVSSSAGVGASSCCTMLLDSWDLSCRWRSSMEQLSYLSAGWDHGGPRAG